MTFTFLDSVIHGYISCNISFPLFNHVSQFTSGCQATQQNTHTLQLSFIGSAYTHKPFQFETNYSSERVLL